MIDIQNLRENPDFITKKSAEKGMEVDVAAILKLDVSYRELLTEVESLRQIRNEISSQMKGGKPEQGLIDKGKQIKIELADRESLMNKSKQELDDLLQQVPNPHFDDVPMGGEHDGLEISRYGNCDSTGAEDHMDYAVKRGWLDFERGAKVAGSKFYFLQGDLALLENALLQYGLSVMQRENFTLMTVPHLVNAKTATGTGFAPRSDEQSDEYFIEGEDLTLIATSEMPLTGYHADEIIDETELPLLYSGYSSCYRKEAGTYGKHTRGLFRVHQFNKLEMYAFVRSENSLEMHEKIREIEESIWQAIDIPYRVINIAAGDLGAPAAKKYDIEYWSRVDGNFRELTSCSNCTDFQTRNLNIRVRKEDGSVELLHSLNGTAISMARSLVAVLEHYQQEDGRLRVPDVLQQYMGGRTTI